MISVQYDIVLIKLFFRCNIYEVLPGFLFSNSHVGPPQYNQIAAEQLQLLHIAAMEICDSTSNALAPNLHAMPAQFKTELSDSLHSKKLNVFE